MADVMPITRRAPAHAHKPTFTRQDIEDAIEHLIGVLDAMDGDADFEPHSDDEPNGDHEPWLGWSSASYGAVFNGGTEDLEADYHEFT